MHCGGYLRTICRREVAMKEMLIIIRMALAHTRTIRLSTGKQNSGGMI